MQTRSHGGRQSSRERMITQRQRLWIFLLSLILFSIIEYIIFGNLDVKTIILDHFPNGLNTVRSVPILLERPFVAISFHYNVQRLSYLQQNLAVLSRWVAAADVCIGTNEPEKLVSFLRNSASRGDGLPGNVSMCPIHNMTSPYLLNWRTREALANAFASPKNYTLFAFLEDDLFVTWKALLKWGEDTEVLLPHGFTRSFFRYEINPLDGHPYTLDYLGQGTPRAVALTDSHNRTRQFVQAGGLEGTYCGMFIATRGQLSGFINSKFWEFQPQTFCCDEGGREDASWKIQSLNTPEGWEKSGVLPFDPKKWEIDQQALIYHSPNNYYARGWKGRSLSEVNAQFKDLLLGTSSTGV